SSAVLILLVAWRSKARIASSRDIPSPSSLTRINRRPPDSTATSIRRAPASIEFSISSLTMDAGRSTTSPAAILFERLSGRTRIFDIAQSRFDNVDRFQPCTDESKFNPKGQGVKGVLSSFPANL